MNVSFRSPITFLTGALLVLLLFSAASAAQASDRSAQSFDQALLRAADQLDAAAGAARLSHGKKGNVPDLRLPPAPPGAASANHPSLERWMRSELGRIRTEKSGKAQAHELSELAGSLRRAAKPGIGYAPARDPHAQAATILAQRAYQTEGAGPAPAPHESVFEKILGWLGNQLDELIRRIFGATASKPIIGQIVAVLYITLVAALAAYLIYLLVSLVLRRRRPPATSEGTPLQEQVEPDVLYQLGLAAASQGRYAQAVSLLFQASLASFDRAGKLPYDGSLTAGEYRRAVRRTLSSASPYFDDIARAFVLAAFAERPVSRDDFSLADAAYRSLRPLLVA